MGETKIVDSAECTFNCIGRREEGGGRTSGEGFWKFGHTRTRGGEVV